MNWIFDFGTLCQQLGRAWRARWAARHVPIFKVSCKELIQHISHTVQADPNAHHPNAQNDFNRFSLSRFSGRGRQEKSRGCLQTAISLSNVTQTLKQTVPKSSETLEFWSDTGSKHSPEIPLVGKYAMPLASDLARRFFCLCLIKKTYL